MFGKSQWFRLTGIGLGLRPVTWRGWMYALTWSAAIGLPFLLLMARQQGPEAFVWLLASSGLLTWDVRGLLRELKVSGKQPVLYIGDDGSCDQLAANQRCHAGK